MLSCLSRVWLIATLWTVARQAPLSKGFSSQEDWSGLPCPPPGDLPNPGIKAKSLMSPALAGTFFTTNATWEAPLKRQCVLSHSDVSDALWSFGWQPAGSSVNRILQARILEWVATSSCRVNDGWDLPCPFLRGSTLENLRVLHLFEIHVNPFKS